jgi:hypothetical protein
MFKLILNFSLKEVSYMDETLLFREKLKISTDLNSKHYTNHDVPSDFGQHCGRKGSITSLCQHFS